eukprot:2532356-Rhodomonas_salina.2
MKFEDFASVSDHSSSLILRSCGSRCCLQGEVGKVIEPIEQVSRQSGWVRIHVSFGHMEM